MADSKTYRSVTTGDRAFMVERGGQQFMRLDRPNQVIERPYKEDDWVEESEHRPLLPHHLTRIYFDAEKNFLIAIGDPEGRNMDWDYMQNADKNDYRAHMLDTDNPILLRLFKALGKVLDPLSK